MRLEPLYRARFSPSERWSAKLTGSAGTEGQDFLLAQGRCEGRVAGSWRAANYPHVRTDGTVVPDFRGALETDDGATILFAWHGYLRAVDGGPSQLVGSMTHLSDDERYRWLNTTVCAVEGEVRRSPEGGRAEVFVDIFELAWEPLGQAHSAAGPQRQGQPHAVTQGDASSSIPFG
jgi:hypothetical protein